MTGLTQSILFNFSLENAYWNNILLLVLALITLLISLFFVFKFLVLIDNRYELSRVGKISLLLFIALLFFSAKIVSETTQKSDALFSIDKGQILYSVKFEQSHFECSFVDVMSCFHISKHISRLEIYDRKSSQLKIVHDCGKNSIFECINLVESKLDRLLNSSKNHLVFDDLNNL